jgi:selenocysteine-specific elongation factor
MAHRIVGTAGHIDHGKTALVQALTGVDTDRLKEEKERGITIELGFAPLELGEGVTVGVVDVPGHERFVRNMLAGAGGIDAVMLVIAADESVKPQTREHFDICRLLGIQAGIVVLTKSDLAEPDLVEIVEEEVRELVAGTFLEGARVVQCSSVTGAGIAEVRQALASCLAEMPDPQRPDFVRLPVDRSFSMKGFGSVITGTLLSGHLTAGTELTLWPSADTLRVRRVEVHGREVTEASAGQRAALNLVSAGKASASRGDLLSAPGRMDAGPLLDVRLELLGACGAGLKDQSRVRFHLGTADVEARVRLLGSRRLLAAGEHGYAQISLARPLAAMVGDRFIIRRPSPPLTLGGGRVVDPRPGRHRRRDSDLEHQVDCLDQARGPDRCALLLQEAAEGGLSSPDLVIRTGRSPEQVGRDLRELATGGRALLAEGGVIWALAEEAVGEMEAQIGKLLAAFHRTHSLSAGMSLEELRRRGAPRTPALLVESVLGRLEGTGRIRREGRLVADSSHQVSLAADEESLLGEVLEIMQGAGLDPPDPHDLLKERQVEKERAAGLVRVLTQRGTLLRISDGFLIHAAVYQGLLGLLQTRRAEEPLIDVAWFKEVTGTSRRTAIPLLEFLDAERVTTRRGNQRYIQPPSEQR